MSEQAVPGRRFSETTFASLSTLVVDFITSIEPYETGSVPAGTHTPAEDVRLAE